jgi:hypothetical protein
MPERLRHFRGYWNTENTRPWVEMFLGKRMSAVAIAKEVGADPSTVTTWLRRHGVEVYAGYHHIERRPPELPPELIRLLSRGPEEVTELIDERVWGISPSEDGMEQLRKFCRFVTLPLEMPVEQVATELQSHRSTIQEWAKGTDMPYLARVASTALRTSVRPGWKIMALRLESGGNVQGPWIQVPTKIQTYDDVAATIAQLTPIEETYVRASKLSISKQQVDGMREDLFAYLLGALAGDASKAGGRQKRFDSSNIDLHLTLKQPTNERLGEFVCMCANSLGICMDRKRDKQPSGSSRFGKHPSAAYRWTSERSPLIAWMFNVGLGLQWDECTTLNQLRMEWIHGAPRMFRIRFIQGLADSDGTVKPSEVIITSVPNADFLTLLLQDLGMTTAHTIVESGRPLRTMVNRKQSGTLPIFNEFVQSYRYQKTMKYSKN